MKKYLSLLLCVLLVASMVLPFAACNGDKTPVTTDVPVTTAEPEPVFNPDEYNVLSIEDYEDKTMLGFLSQVVGFLSGYEFAKNSDGTATTAMPDGWFEMCNGPYAELNRRNKHVDKLLKNEETGLWETWNDDDFSIDILNQYILADMYDTYGTFASKVIKDGWIKYNVWDMGGGHRTYGAYGLMSKYFYLPQFSGSSEYGNQYNVNGEPYIANETLGMDAAGMPEVTVNMAEIFGSATSDRDPVLWLKFFSAMYSMAYFEDDVPTLIRTAQKVLPAGSWQSEVIDQVFALKEKYPSDWRRAVVNAEKLCYQAKYDMDSYIGESSINCSFILIGLLYGEGDFYNTCKIISLAGHGGDSTTPVGLGVVGIITGWDGLDDTSKAIINEKVWQDGKGVIINDHITEKSGYWMYMAGLGTREIYMKDILDMYQQNFESVLLENGGIIQDGNYYIPKAYETFKGLDTIYYDDFESGNADNFSQIGNVQISPDTYTGNYGLKLVGNAVESSAYVTFEGLTVGETYRVSSFISTTAGTTAELFVKNSAGEKVASAHVHDQNLYVRRPIIFTATDSTMQVGVSIPAGTSSHRYAIIDEFMVIRAEENDKGEAKITTSAADNKYTGKVDFAINANTDKEVYLKVTFSNAVGKNVNATVYLDGEEYAGVPFYKTGVVEHCNDVVYIPVVAMNDATSYTVTIDFGTDEIYIYDAELVTVTDTF